MNALRKKLQNLMSADHRKGRFSYLESFLFVVSFAYAAAVKLRAIGYQSGILVSKRLPCKVISVGNITVGGTGKTPMAVYLARLLRQLGHRIAVISRGYRGDAEKSGGIVSNGREILLGVQSAGDEPVMMAKQLKDLEIPLLVGQNRYRIGLLAVREFKPDVIILDDGFQHLKLVRDINLVLLDSRRPFGNKHLLPRGPLRETLSSLSRGDAFIMTRFDPTSNDAGIASLDELKGELSGRPIFSCSHVPYVYRAIKGSGVATESFTKRPISSELESIKGRSVFAFSGIARNDDFRRTVERFGCDMKGFMDFPDHHRYSDNDLNNIYCAARDTDAEIFLTTEKDYTRLDRRIHWPMDLVIIGIKISFGRDESDFSAFIKKRLL
jgi:tetraacyldisaccharide 4'-kinase